MFKINFQWNGWGAQGSPDDFLLLRAGEVAIKNGYPYFLTQAEGGANFVGIPTSIVIKCYKTKPEGKEPYDAEVVVKFLKAKYKLK